MKKSTQNTCSCLIVAVLMGIAAVIMACFQLLPELICLVTFAVKFAAAALLLLFVMAALSGCHCMRKLHVALCRYGKCLVVALVGAMLTGLLLIAIGMLCAPVALGLVALFAFTTLFVLALLAFALVVYTMVSLGCPKPCPPPCPKPMRHDCNEENDFTDCKF